MNELRSQLIDSGVLRPNTDQPTRILGIIQGPRLLLDDAGRARAAKRVALGRKGVIDTDTRFDSERLPEQKARLDANELAKPIGRMCGSQRNG